MAAPRRAARCARRAAESKFLSVISGAFAVSVLLQASAANGELLPKKFSLKAPNAKAVEINAEWSKRDIPLERAEDGTWSVTLASIPAGVWTYSFLVDGLNVLDPANPEINPQYSELEKNILHVPSSPPAQWDWQDVPHGVIHTHDYQSKALGQRRQLLVYTPGGYNANLAQRYPLLVLQHGSGGSRSSWVVHGRANLIFDNLIAAGEAKAMVVVMMDGHSSGTYQGREIKGVESFSLELLEDALPLVEKGYRLAESPENRAIVGLSMGAKQSTTVGLGNLDRFAWVGGFSAISYPDHDVLKVLLASPEETNKKLKLLWLAWGSGDARAVKAGEPFVDELEKSGIKLQWKVTEGGHEWPVWRRCLVDILPLLFQN